MYVDLGKLKTVDSRGLNIFFSNLFFFHNVFLYIWNTDMKADQKKYLCILEQPKDPCTFCFNLPLHAFSKYFRAVATIREKP